MATSTYANAAALASGDQRTQERLVKILGLLGSEHGGERAAAALKADAFVRNLGLRWSDVISVPVAASLPQGRNVWTRLARYCIERSAHLNARERLFVETILKWQGKPEARPPSEKQQDWLRAIFTRLRDIGD